MRCALTFLYLGHYHLVPIASTCTIGMRAIKEGSSRAPDTHHEPIKVVAFRGTVATNAGLAIESGQLVEMLLRESRKNVEGSERETYHAHLSPFSSLGILSGQIEQFADNLRGYGGGEGEWMLNSPRNVER